MKSLIVFLLLLLSACCTPVPLSNSFPDVPSSFMTLPSPLTEVPDNSSFSQMLDVILDNYGKYYDISAQLKSWQIWYTKNKEIFDKVK